MITEKVEEIESTGKLGEIIEKHAIDCINGVVRDAFQWSGTAKKSIEEALKGKLDINPENLNLLRYQKIVTNIVEEHVNRTIIKDLGDEIKSAVGKITEVIEKKEWKLSEIIKYLEATDIYICSNLNPNQITSGTLAYALGAGRAVISTKFGQ